MKGTALLISRVRFAQFVSGYMNLSQIHMSYINMHIFQLIEDIIGRLYFSMEPWQAIKKRQLPTIVTAC